MQEYSKEIDVYLLFFCIRSTNISCRCLSRTAMNDAITAIPSYFPSVMYLEQYDVTCSSVYKTIRCNEENLSVISSKSNTALRPRISPNIHSLTMLFRPCCINYKRDKRNISYIPKYILVMSLECFSLSASFCVALQVSHAFFNVDF